MKHNLCQIKNVTKANTTLNYLGTRPRNEMVGLGLVYGAPGLGKTRWALNAGLTKNFHVYVRLDSTETQKSFLIRLYQGLQNVYGVVATVRGSKQKIYLDIVDILIEAPQTVVFIDEIDYAFKDKQLLGTIRDLADETLATFILVGMQDAKNSLLKANAHYFDRCNSFCEFKPLSLEDTALVCAEVCEVALEPEVVKFVHRRTKGTLRRIVKALDMFERTAKSKKLKKITLADLGSVDE